MTDLNEKYKTIKEKLQQTTDEEAEKLLNSLSLEEISEIKKEAMNIGHSRHQCSFLGINYNDPPTLKLNLAAYYLINYS